jgi:hypothetical protein
LLTGKADMKQVVFAEQAVIVNVISQRAPAALGLEPVIVIFLVIVAGFLNQG